MEVVRITEEIAKIRKCFQDKIDSWGRTEACMIRLRGSVTSVAEVSASLGSEAQLLTCVDGVDGSHTYKGS